MWFELKGDQRLTMRCATKDCGGQPTWRLEAGGVGSYYCPGCKAKLAWLDEPSEVTVRRWRTEDWPETA